MTKQQKKQNLRENEFDVSKLVALYECEIKQMSEYHFRINDRVDFWPSSKKWWDKKTGRKGDYEDLVDFVKEYLHLGMVE